MPPRHDRLGDVDAAMTDGTGDAAALAAAVLDEEAARQEAQARAREQVIFPDDLLPGVELGAGQLQAKRSPRGGVMMFVVLGLLLAFDELEGARDPDRSSPRSRRRSTSASGTVVFIGTASAAFFVLGAVPMGWLADRVKRVPIVGIAALVLRRSSSFLSGLALNAFMFFWTSASDRHRQGEQHPGAPVADRRQLPDRHPRPDVGGHEHGRARHRHHQPDPRRRDRDVGRRPRGLALGLVHPRHPGRDRRGLRVLHEGTAARAVREGRRARRGHRGREPRADLDGGRVRAAEEDRDDPHVDRRVLRPRLRPVQPGRAASRST